MNVLNIKKEIIFRLFDSDQRMIGFLFEPDNELNLRERPETLLEDAWDLPPECRVLVRTALDIWNGSGNVFLWELLNHLSYQGFHRMVLALSQAKAIEKSLHQTQRGQNVPLE